MTIAISFLIILLLVTALTARWSSTRARRRTLTFLTRVSALPAIGAAAPHRSGRGPAVADDAPVEARIYFLEVYREGRRRRAAATRASGDRIARSLPTLSLEHPRPARGA